MEKKISIINYGVGNILSINNAINFLGFDALLTMLSTKITDIVSDKDVGSDYYINERQQFVLKDIVSKSEELIKIINSGLERDVLAALVKDLLDTLNEIVDPINKEDVINNIFSNFCVGK